MALRALDFDAHLAEADPTAHAAQITMMLRHAAQLVDNATRHQPKVSGIQRQPDIGKLRHHSVEHVIAEPQKPRFFAPYTLCIDDVVTLLKLFHELRNYFWNVLQISIHHYYCVPADMIKCRGNSGLMAEISRQGKHKNALVLLSGGSQNFIRAIRTPVVNKDEFVRAARQAVQNVAKPAQQFGQHALLIVERNCNREAKGAGHARLRSFFVGHSTIAPRPLAGNDGLPSPRKK